LCNIRLGSRKTGTGASGRGAWAFKCIILYGRRRWVFPPQHAQVSKSFNFVEIGQDYELIFRRLVVSKKLSATDIAGTWMAGRSPYSVNRVVVAI
jgi:hypothetical protein